MTVPWLICRGRYQTEVLTLSDVMCRPRTVRAIQLHTQQTCDPLPNGQAATVERNAVV